MSQKKPPQGRGGGQEPHGRQRDGDDDTIARLIALMEDCSTAESLNDRVITPFSVALERVCLARGYVLNIYGEGSNIVISSEEDAETIYHLVDEYLDQAE